MIELLFVVCLAGATETCEERGLLFFDVTPTECVIGAQPELAKWANAHAGFTIKSWRCRKVGIGEREI